LLALVESVISEDPEFYASLQMSLPNLAEIEELFQRSAKTWLTLVRDKDDKEFARRMGAVRDRFERLSA
jgi:prephenate dehydrogenase